MKKNFKGFTLVECIVAMAILGIASLLIAQIYAAVSTRNKMNNLVNTSLSYQMAYVEKYTDSDTVGLYFGGPTAKAIKDPDSLKGSSATGKAPHEHMSANNISSPFVQIESEYSSDKFSYAVDVYVLQSRDRQGNTLTEIVKDSNGNIVSGGDSGYGEKDYNLRYKYIIGHNNK